MVKPLMKDPLFLAHPSEPASPMDVGIACDLIDTLNAHRDDCVGMAANMIGELKRIIVIDSGTGPVVMYNPEIIKKSEPYEAEEGCLSISGIHKAKRYRKIKVSFQNADFKPRIMNFSGWTAQIIQHEIDHCSGILI